MIQLPQEMQDLCRADFRDRPVVQRFSQRMKLPLFLVHGGFEKFPFTRLLKVLFGDQEEGCAGLRFRFDPIKAFMDAWVSPIRQQRSGVTPFGAGLC